MKAQEQFSILLVDDDVIVVRILSRILSDFSRLRFATSGRAALKLARESTPDLMLLDVDMPELSGFEVCKAFKSDPALAEVPIIFITSHESAQLQAKGLELGAVDFISKPPHPPLVLARVRTYQRLKTLSDTMRSAVKIEFLTGAAHRPADLPGRYAGGKFALLLPETNGQGARTVAQRAIDGVSDLQIPHPAGVDGGCVTLSVGGGCRHSSRSITGNATAGAVPNDLIKAAEQALESARSEGKYQARIVDSVEFGNAQPHRPKPDQLHSS
jgi:PleD family two-component response regulator